jgi:hypothetical protein
MPGSPACVRRLFGIGCLGRAVRALADRIVEYFDTKKKAN